MLVHLNTPEQAANWLRERVTGTLHTDSRRVRAGGLRGWLCPAGPPLATLPA